MTPLHARRGMSRSRSNLFVPETGGRYFLGRNDLDREIAASEERALFYYTLTCVLTETILGVLSSLDAKGKLLNDTITRLTLAVPAAPADQLDTGHSTLRLQTIVPSDAKALRAVFRDASGRIGTAVLPLDQVPALAVTKSEWKKATRK